MADELKIPLDPFTDTGLTLLGKVYNSTGSQEGSTVSMSEDGPALYIGDFDVTTRNDGQYVVRFETNTPDKLYGTGALYVRDGKEVSPEMYFNQSLDTVANVTLVATTTTNTDMRGTDGANTVTPDNAGISANGNSIAALNNFDPSTDQVTVATNNDKTNYSLTNADKDDIVDRNWDESHDQHKTAGTFGWLMDLLRKANRAIEGEVTGTPTTTSFTSNITGYVTGAFDSEVLVFVSGTINGEARPILDYDSTNGTFNFEEAWTQAPSSSDEFVILPYHVHAISEIQEGLATRNNQNTINENVKKSSKLIPASGNLPDN